MPIQNAKTRDRLAWPVSWHVTSVVWQLPAEPLAPTSRFSSRTSICTLESWSGDRLIDYGGSIRRREPHYIRFCVERASHPRPQRNKVKELQRLWEDQRPPFVHSSLAGMVSFQTLGMVGAVVAIGLMARSMFHTCICRRQLVDWV